MEVIQYTEIEQKIKEIRGEKIILDFEIAELYGIETKKLNQAVSRNLNRFPEDFIFELTEAEWNSLRSQFVTSIFNKIISLFTPRLLLHIAGNIAR